MAKVNVLVLRSPGANCDLETCHAFERGGARPTRVHINALLEAPDILADYQVLVVPGGFSYGDDVAAGKILANQLRVGLADELRAFRDRGKLILGICNGFQVLIKSGLLPGWDDGRGTDQPATLANNDSGRFTDRWIHLAAEPGECVFLQGIDRMDLPIAHGEGKFACRDQSVLDRLESGGQIVLRYAPKAVGSRHLAVGQESARSASTAHCLLPTASCLSYNPNGSQADVAGICDPTGRVFGLMPHPERHVDSVQHPQWTRGRTATEGDGLAVFRNAVAFFGRG
jgi:phosphoribosylformylglycinamidine synthase